MSEEQRPMSEDFQQPSQSQQQSQQTHSAPHTERTWWDEIDLAGNQLVDEVKRLLHEGNIRRFRIKHDGKVLVEVPVTAAAGVGAATVLLAPQIAILGALAGIVTHCTIEIEHSGTPPTTPTDRLS